MSPAIEVAEDLLYEGYHREAGTVLDVPDDVAERLLASGQAIEPGSSEAEGLDALTTVKALRAYAKEHGLELPAGLKGVDEVRAAIVAAQEPPDPFADVSDDDLQAQADELLIDYATGEEFDRDATIAAIREKTAGA